MFIPRFAVISLRVHTLLRILHWSPKAFNRRQINQ